MPARRRPAARRTARSTGIPYDECGKLVVALDDERARRGCASIERRAPGQRRARRCAGSSATELREIEPHAAGVAGAALAARPAIVDYRRGRAGATPTTSRGGGGTVRLGTEVDAIEPAGERRACRDRPATSSRSTALVVCAGCSPTASRGWPATSTSPAIVPFRGEYYAAAPERDAPGPRPDLPGARPALPVPRRALHPPGRRRRRRRAQRRPGVRPRGLPAARRRARRPRRDARAGRGFRRLARQHWRIGRRARCAARCRKRRVRRRAPARYVPELRPPTSCRRRPACAPRRVDRDGTLVDDFRISRARPGHRRPQRAVARRRRRRWRSPSTSARACSISSGSCA